MQKDASQTSADQKMTGDDVAGDVEPASTDVIPVSPARFAELQENGLCGIAPERALMRVDLASPLYEDLADIATSDVAMEPD